MQPTRSPKRKDEAMSRSVWRTLLALVAIVAMFTLAACGGDDEEGSGGTPAASGGEASATDQLFAGSATENRENPEEGGVKGGTIRVLSNGDVDYMDPGKTYYT